MTKNTSGWKWFFGVLALLTVSASVSLIWYSQAQQLRPEQFEAAAAHWAKHKPRSYRLRYKDTFSSQAGETTTNDYAVEVRDGKVVEVLVNGSPKAERLEYHDMEGLFSTIERFLDLDEKEKRKVYRIGVFDPESGALRRYVRRVMASRERQEIIVEPLQAE